MKLFDLVTGTASKPWLSGNMLPNIKTCGNGWSNFYKKNEYRSIKSGRFNSILITKIYQLTVIYLNFVRCWGPTVNVPDVDILSIYREVYGNYHYIRYCTILSSVKFWEFCRSKSGNFSKFWVAALLQIAMSQCTHTNKIQIQIVTVQIG